MSNYYYSKQGSIHVPRTRFDLSHHHKTMFNAGEIIPLDWKEVYPGDSFKTTVYTAVRTTAPFIRPVMDNMFMDQYTFFVPYRLIWDNWEEFMGANKTDDWTDANSYSVPKVNAKQVSVNSLADYLGIPPSDYETLVGTGGIQLNALPFRAYALIYNEFWRNQNVDTPSYIDKGNTAYDLNNTDFGPTNIFGKCAIANKLNDYFTSCLPEPQKGDPVFVSAKLDLPVITGVDNGASLLGNNNPLKWSLSNNGASHTASVTEFLGIPGGGGSTTLYGLDTGVIGPSVGSVVPRNLHAVSGASGVETALFNVRELTEAKAFQVALEKDARGGTRYIEYLYAHWNVLSDNDILQRPELLGGVRTPLNISQVNQTSGTDPNSNTDLLGQVGAYSLSNPSSSYEKGFTEHGIIMTLGVVRQHHTYQQGIDKAWFRDQRFDYYDPCFANIGEQPVYKRELDIVNQGDTTNVFGYNEAWADLRYSPSRISGSLRSGSNTGFDIWHFGDVYSNTPGLDSTFMKESSAYIDRALAVPSTTAPQFVIDCYFDMKAVRCLPMYSIPSHLD